MCGAPVLRRWLSAFVFTQLVEIPIYRRWFGASVSVAFGASAITHPIVWLVFMYWGRLLGFSFATRAVSAELFAFFVEALYFAYVLRPRPGAGRALAGSLIANGASLGLGFLAQALFNWP